jgi:hypothetical protein
MESDIKRWLYMMPLIVIVILLAEEVLIQQFPNPPEQVASPESEIKVVITYDSQGQPHVKLVRPH